jgi:hypothetical protein
MEIKLQYPRKKQLKNMGMLIIFEDIKEMDKASKPKGKYELVGGARVSAFNIHIKRNFKRPSVFKREMKIAAFSKL